MAVNYNKALVKFNNGNGALLCNGCRVIIATGFDHEDKKHYCKECVMPDRKIFELDVDVASLSKEDLDKLKKEFETRGLPNK